MPCLNEEKTIAACIEQALKFRSTVNFPVEILIADNGSDDKSVKIAEKLGAKVIHVKEKGYGNALRAGIEKAAYNYILMGDADESYDFYHIQQFIDQLDKGYDLIMGNRFSGGIDPGAMSFSHRYIGNPILSWLGRVFYKTDIRDFHCGERAFRKDSILGLGLCTAGMEFASEMVVKAVLFGLKIIEVPCKLHKDGRNRPPHLRSIPDGLRHLRFLLIYSPVWLFFIPGLIMFILGLAFMIGIYIRPIQIGGFRFEVTTMFYAAMVTLLGIQIMQFFIYTNIYGKRIGQFPHTSKAVQNIEKVMLSKGIPVGIIVGLTGIIGIIFTLYQWKQVGFGILPDTRVCQTAIVFGSIFIMGIEFLFSSFFVNVLSMGTNEGGR